MLRAINLHTNNIFMRMDMPLGYAAIGLYTFEFEQK